jgi:hypothetical protein
MTIEEFRSREDLVAGMSALLSSETMLSALSALSAAAPSPSVQDDADAVVSARRLSEIKGYSNFYASLLSLGFPLPPAEQEEEPATFGADLAKIDADFEKFKPTLL